MKLNSLHIYGFGKWQDKHLDFSNKINVIYGKNEAGKSTIMAFIHFILFGFTKREEEERYRPKHANSFGGKMIVTVEGKKLVVERKKLESKEYFVVTDEFGAVIENSLWKKYLKNMDQNYFESIFSFNQLGLQKITQLKNEDISKYLFSSSVVGSDQLYAIEKNLDKQMNELLGKRTSKNKKITMQLAELNEAYDELKSYEQNIASYEEKIVLVEQITEQMEKVTQQVEETQKELFIQKQLLELKDIIFELEELERQLNEFSFVYITEDEMLQFQTLNNDLTTIECTIEELEVEVTQELEKLKNFLPRKISEDDLLEVDQVIQLGQMYDEKFLEYETLKQKVVELNEQMNTLVLQEGLQIDEEVALTLNSSSLLKEEITVLVDEYKAIQASIRQLKNEIEQVDLSSQKKELELLKLQSEMLPEEEIERLDSISNDAFKHRENILRREIASEQLASKQTTLKREIMKYKKARKKQLLASFVAFVISLLLIVGGWISEMTIPLTAGIILFILSCFGLFYKWKSPTVEQLRKEMEQLKQTLDTNMDVSVNEMDIEEVNFLLKDHQEKVQVYQRWNESLLELRNRRDTLNTQMNKFIYQLDYLDNKKNELLEEWQMETNYTVWQLPLIFELIATYKNIYLQKNKTEEQLQVVKEWLTQLEEKAHRLASLWDLNDEDPMAILLSTLGKQKNNYVASTLEYKQRAVQLQKIKELLAQKEANKLKLDEQLMNWIERKKLATKDDFYIAYESSKEYKRKELRKEQLQLTLKTTSLGADRIEAFIKNPTDSLQIKKVEMLEQELKMNLEHMISRRIELLNEMKILEEGRSFDTITLDYEQKKASYEKTVEQWMELAVAKEKLQRTIRFYTDEKLPHILTVASNYISQLTHGKYLQITFNEQERFLVKHSSNTFFEITQLSQSTMEQVYISIRLALANHIFNDVFYPIIIDDGFVHFDLERLKAILHVLENNKEHQILLFTCHEHLLKELSYSHIIDIA